MLKVIALKWKYLSYLTEENVCANPVTALILLNVFILKTDKQLIKPQ